MVLSIRLALAALLLGVVVGCQGGSPTATPAGQPANDSFPAGAALDPGGSGDGMLLMGQLSVDADTRTISLTPVRSGGAVGDDFTLDATEFFTAAPCVDCLKISHFEFGGDVLYLDVTVRHPFPNIIQRRD
ncbi:MAG: hypothetical protein ABI743_06190, partial [bacterium]